MCRKEQRSRGGSGAGSPEVQVSVSSPGEAAPPPLLAAGLRPARRRSEVPLLPEGAAPSPQHVRRRSEAPPGVLRRRWVVGTVLDSRTTY